jgi:SNF2 family DNA or RNA helicase
LVSTYGCGSLGLNFQFCNNIIFLSQTFDYKDKEQGTHRLYRIGQKKDINCYNFYCDTGLEDIIKQSLDKKQNILKNIKSILKRGEYEKL